jgi:adhesin/invasin
VGDDHVFTATVETYDGISWSPLAGATVTFTITDGPGILDPDSTTTGLDGKATTTLSSNVTGTTTVSASATINGLTISTDGTAENSEPAKKVWVLARIMLAPLEDTNVVGDPHEFIATVETSTDGGTTWSPYQDATVTFQKIDGPGTLVPDSDTTDASGQAKTTLTSDQIGTTTVSASTTVYGTTISTGVSPGSSNNATKHWVDARIRLTPPSDTNVVGDDHVFTATVETYDGISWSPLAGATVTFTITDGPGILDPDSTTTGLDGKATTTLSSNVTGTTTVSASATINGLTISTDGTAENSEPAKKDWVLARIMLAPLEDTNVVGDPHEFIATVETSTDGGTTWSPYQDATVTFQKIDGPGTLVPDSDTTDASGQAKTTLTSDQIGTTTVSASTTVYGTTISTGVSQVAATTLPNTGSMPVSDSLLHQTPTSWATTTSSLPPSRLMTAYPGLLLPAPPSPSQ